MARANPTPTTAPRPLFVPSVLPASEMVICDLLSHSEDFFSVEVKFWPFEVTGYGTATYQLMAQVADDNY